MDCELFKKGRGKLVECIAEIWIQKKSHGNLSLSEELLLGLHFSDKLNSKKDHRVKLALFKYLQVTKVI